MKWTGLCGCWTQHRYWTVFVSEQDDRFFFFSKESNFFILRIDFWEILASLASFPIEGSGLQAIFAQNDFPINCVRAKRGRSLPGFRCCPIETFWCDKLCPNDILLPWKSPSTSSKFPYLSLENLWWRSCRFCRTIPRIDWLILILFESILTQELIRHFVTVKSICTFEGNI